MSSAIELHGLSGCPFAWRTRITAHEKGIPFDVVFFDTKPEDPRALRNPERKSPLLVHGDFSLIESLAIQYYLDEAFPGPSLQPVEPKDRAHMRVAITQIAPSLPDWRPGHRLSEKDREVLARSHDAIAGWLSNGEGFLVGPEPTLADCYVWPFLAHALSLGVDFTADRPQLAEYWTRVSSRPSFFDTRPEWAKREQA